MPQLYSHFVSIYIQVLKIEVGHLYLKIAYVLSTFFFSANMGLLLKCFVPNGFAVCLDLLFHLIKW